MDSDKRERERESERDREKLEWSKNNGHFRAKRKLPTFIALSH